MNIHAGTAAHDPIAAKLTPADDRVLLSKWLPPQAGVMPKVRIGRRWISVLWALPIAFLVLVLGVAIAQGLRHLPEVQAFLVRYPGTPADARSVDSGFPVWLRLTQFGSA